MLISTRPVGGKLPISPFVAVAGFGCDVAERRDRGEEPAHHRAREEVGPGVTNADASETRVRSQ